ncbi:MAG: helix-turn-helix transcriptional regulator [Firmicutes bacterium]|nr:helix-turn-helix transcriptional regulator [Bacillota bacterium]
MAKETNKETMGRIIASKRKELGLTQLELAEKMGVTDKAVSKWERDLSYPDVSSLPRLADVFGMSVDELMQIKTESARPDSPSRLSELRVIIPRALCLALGVAVAVLALLGELSMDAAAVMLGVGLACAGVSLMDNR